MINLQDDKNRKIGDSFLNPKDNKTYYFDGLNWVLPLRCIYKNYKGILAERCVIPMASFYGITDYYIKPTWLLNCLDVEKQEYRTFAFDHIVRFL